MTTNGNNECDVRVGPPGTGKIDGGQSLVPAGIVGVYEVGPQLFASLLGLNKSMLLASSRSKRHSLQGLKLDGLLHWILHADPVELPVQMNFNEA
jgi:hypothetical protein